MATLSQEEMDAIFSRGDKAIQDAEKPKPKKEDSSIFSGMASMAAGMNPSYFATSGTTPSLGVKPEPSEPKADEQKDDFQFSAEQKKAEEIINRGATLAEKSLPKAEQKTAAEQSDFPLINAARDYATEGIGNLAKSVSFDEPPRIDSELANYLHTLSPSKMTPEIRAEAAAEMDPEKLKQWPEWMVKTEAQHRAMFDQKHADTTLAEDAKKTYNLGVNIAKGFGDMVVRFGAGVAKAPAMFLEGPGTYGSISDPEEWKRWGTTLGKLATVPAATVAESGESVVETVSNVLQNGLSATDWLERKAGVISDNEAFDRYLRRHRADEYYAGWKATDPNVFTRVVMEDPYAREVAENLVYSLTSTFSPSVEDRLERHGGNRDAALREKQLDDLKSSQELLSSIRQEASTMVPDADLREAASFTRFGLNPFDIYGKAMGVAMTAAKKAKRAAQVAGKSGEEIAAMDAAAAKAAFADELKAAQDAQVPGFIEEGTGKLANAIDMTGARLAGALESIPSPIRAGASSLIGGAIGAANDKDSPITGFMEGAAIGLGGHLGRSTIAKAGSVIAQTPRLATAAMAGRRLAAGGVEKNVAGLGRVLEESERLGMDPKLSRWLADKGIPAARTLDWVANNAVDMARGSVHGMTLAAAVGVLENKDPEQIADMMGQGIFLHIGGHVLGNLAGVTHDRYQSNLKRQRAEAAKFVNALDPETRAHIDKLTDWETYVAAIRNLSDEAAQSYANAQMEHVNLVNSGASPEKIAKSQEQVDYAKKVLSIRQAQTKNAQTAGVETARMYGDQVRIGLADLMNSVNGSMSPGKNVEFKIQTTNELIQDALYFNRNKMLTPLEETELIAMVMDRAGQRAYNDKRGGEQRLSTGKVVSLSDPNKGKIGINIDMVRNRILAGESVLTAVAHEAGHAFYDMKEFREQNAEVINKLFGTPKIETGRMIPGEDGLFSEADLVKRFKEYYAEGTVGGWEEMAQTLGLLDKTTGELIPERTAEYMREEVMAELIRGASQGGISLGLEPKPWLAPLVDWLTVKNKTSKVSRVLREFVGLHGREPWSSKLVGAMFSGETIEATRKALQAVADLKGDVSAAEMIPHRPVSEVELKSNLALAEQFKEGLFATEKVVSVVDKEGNPIIDPATGNSIPSFPLSDVTAFEGTWQHIEGEPQLVQTSGYGEFPAEVAEKLGNISIPPDAKIVVNSRVKRDATGALQLLTPQEIKALNRARGNIIRKAMEDATDREYPRRLSAQSADRLSYGGVLSPEQVKNLMGLPETIVPFEMKRRIIEFNQLLVNDNGEGMVGLYRQAMDRAGKSKSFSPKIVDFVPMGIKLSKDGNFLFTLFTRTGMNEKLRRWQKDSPQLLNLWEGNKEAFVGDLKKVLENWKPTEQNPNGLPGETGLDPSPAIALSKKNRINDFLSMYRKTEDASRLANPDRTQMKRPARRLTKDERIDESSSDPNTLIRSYAVERFHDVAKSASDPLRIDYNRALYNFLPDMEAEPSETEKLKLQPSFNPSILRGLSALNFEYRPTPVSKPAVEMTEKPAELDARKNVGVRFMPEKEEDLEYRGTHKAPGSENGSPLHDVTKTIYPGDFYTLPYNTVLQYYGSGDKVSDAESLKAIRAAKGNPEALVTIYRATPKAVDAINEGDWVTPSKTYAMQHGESSLLGEYNILEKKVPASHLYTEGNSLSEFGYNPPTPTIRFMPASLEIREERNPQMLEFWDREIERSGIKAKPTTANALKMFIYQHITAQRERGYEEILPKPSPEKIKAYYQKTIKDVSPAEAAGFPEEWLQIRRMTPAQFNAQFTQERVDELTKARTIELARTANYLFSNGGYPAEVIAGILNSARRIRVNAQENENGELVPVIQKITDSNEAMPNEISGATAARIWSKMRWDVIENGQSVGDFETKAKAEKYVAEMAQYQPELKLEIRQAMGSDEAFVAGVMETFKKAQKKKGNKTGWEVYDKSDQIGDAEALNSDLIGTNWCTGGCLKTARDHLSGGDFHVYFKNGDPQIAIRTDSGNIKEVRGRGKGQNITSPELDAIAEKYITSEKGIKGGEDYLHDVNFRKASAKYKATGILPASFANYFNEYGLFDAKPQHSYASRFDQEYLDPVSSLLKLKDGNIVSLSEDSLKDHSLWLLEKAAQKIAENGKSNYLSKEEVSEIAEAINTGNSQKESSLANKISDNIYSFKAELKAVRRDLTDQFQTATLYGLEMKEYELREEIRKNLRELSLAEFATYSLETLLWTTSFVLEKSMPAGMDCLQNALESARAESGVSDKQYSSIRKETPASTKAAWEEFLSERDANLRSVATPIEFESNVERIDGTESGQTRFMPNKEEHQGELDQFSDRWKESGVRISPTVSSNGDIRPNVIIVPQKFRKQGIGTSVMQELADIADKQGRRISISPSTDFGGSSVNRLKDFYSRFGFIENKGKNKDFTIRETMYREPSPTPLSEQSSPASNKPRYSPAKLDSEYATAFEAKDEEKARGLVDQAAKQAGYNYKVYRGVENDYIKGDGYVFGKADQTYFTGNRALAETYANFMGQNPEGVVYDTYLRLENPFIPEDINDAANFEYNAKRLREKGYDGVIGSHGGVEGARNGQVDVAVAFDPSQIKSADPFTYDNEGKLIPLSERFKTNTGDIRFMPAKLDSEYTSAFETKDEEKARGMVRKAAEQAGYTRNAKHGTTHKFTVFNLSRSNAENDMGRGFYFSTSLKDVESNYAGKGPDLTNRIERLTESLYDSMDETQIDEYGSTDAAYAAAKEQAEQSLVGGEQRVIDAFINLKKPLIIGSKEETEFEAKFESEDSEPTGSIMELVESVQNKADEYQAPYEAQEAISKLMELGMDYGTVSAREAVDIIKKSFENVYDPDTGDIAVSEFTREVFKDAGFDGIVDNTVNEKFGTRRKYGKGMEGMGEDTQHIIVFNPESIKSADPFTYDDAGNLIPLSERFNAGTKDIRFMPEKPEEEAVRLANSTARAAGAVGAKAITPRYVASTTAEGESVLNFGAGKPDKSTGKYLHSEMVREKGANVEEYDFGGNSTGGLGKLYDTVFASNVLNVQSSEGMLESTVGQIWDSVADGGRAVFNYPESPRYIEMSPKEVAATIKAVTGIDPVKVGGTNGAPLWEVKSEPTGMRFLPAKEEKVIPDMQHGDPAQRAPLPAGKTHYNVGITLQNGESYSYKYDPSRSIEPPVKPLSTLKGQRVGILQADRHDTIGDNMGGPMHPWLASNQVVVTAPDGKKYKIVWANMNKGFVTRTKNRHFNHTDGFHLVYTMEKDAHASNIKFVTDYIYSVDAMVNAGKITTDQLDATKGLFEMAKIREDYAADVEAYNKNRRGYKKYLSSVKKRTGALAKLEAAKAKGVAKKDLPKVPAEPADFVVMQKPKRPNSLEPIAEFMKRLSPIKSGFTRGQKPGKEHFAKKAVDELNELIQAAKQQSWYKDVLARVAGKTLLNGTATLSFNARKLAMKTLSGIPFLPSVSEALSSSEDFKDSNTFQVVGAVELSKNRDAFAVYFGNDPNEAKAMSKTEVFLRDQFLKNPAFKVHPSYPWMMLGPENGRHFLVEDGKLLPEIFLDYGTLHPKLKKKDPSKLTTALLSGSMLLSPKTELLIK